MFSVLKGHRAMTLEYAKEQLNVWYNALQAVATGQSYSIAGRQLSRVSVPEIRMTIAYWEAKVARLERGGYGIRIRRTIPRDL